ncbi:hypothetical protein [Plantactinospora endophytica]|uniref:Orc1-like AAA ATPase domain-containing protein n=1 Tax=Plantactinospora endophytica TaxID=673535 RepID=A0ABQ4E6W7_9ACTN|nr:hypothetical protein [Plantactinospora endophytica]GIG90409.1 hypothetical protein Pen02_53450 [Plantactinospora endophytica]
MASAGHTGTATARGSGAIAVSGIAVISEQASQSTAAGQVVAPSEYSWSVAVYRPGGDERPRGAGVVTDAWHVLTCRQIVPQPGRGGRVRLRVAFPTSEPMTMEWREVAAVIYGDGPEDIFNTALLRLAEPVPDGVKPATLRRPPGAALRGRRWWTFGFPDAEYVGGDAHGTIGAALGWGLVRLHSDSMSPLDPGFSGAGLWLPDYGAVAGIVTPGAVDQPGGRAATLHQIAVHLPRPLVHARTTWSLSVIAPQRTSRQRHRERYWVMDSTVREHWLPRARGVSAGGERGHRFRGRRAALTTITNWLDRPVPDRRVLIVTGAPGAGKSAVLGRVVVTADPGIGPTLPADAEVRATQGSVDCAVHAKGKTALDVASEIARAQSLALPDRLEDLAPTLHKALDSQPNPRLNLVVDALDEAATPDEARLIAIGLIQPLVETCADVGVQVVVGTRRRDDNGDLISSFADGAEVVDLDDVAFFDPRDLVDYALATLQLSGEERPGSPYSEDAVARPVAARIGALAQGNFLIAGLIARAHGMFDAEALAPAEVMFTPTVDDALSRYLDRLEPVGGISAKSVLTVLAYVEAPGLTVELWELGLRALETVVTASQLAEFARSSAANFLLETRTPGDGLVYRLFHQALNDALLRRRRNVNRDTDDEQRIVRSWLGHGRQLGWADAPAYLLRSLPLHLARSGRIDDLLTDDEYLLHADLRRLAAVADAATTPDGRRRARLVELTLHAARAVPAERAAMFSVTDALERLDAPLAVGITPPYRASWAASLADDGDVTNEGHTDSVWGVCPLYLDGRTLLASASADYTIRLWDLQDDRAATTLRAHTSGVAKVCTTVVGGRTHLVSAADDHTVRMWNPSTGTVTKVFEGHENLVLAVCDVPVGDRHLVASGSADGTVRLWDPETGEPVHVLGGHRGQVRTVRAVPVGDRNLLASAGRDRVIRLWDPDLGVALRTLEGHDGSIRAMRTIVVAGRTLLASGSADRSVRLWDPLTGELVRTLRGQRGGIWAVCPVRVGENQLLASAADDRSVWLWDPTTGQPLRALAGVESWVWDLTVVDVAGVQLLASGDSRGTVALWDPATGARTRTFAGRSVTSRGMTTLDIGGSPALVTADSDHRVRMRHLRTGATVRVLAGHGGTVRSVCAVPLPDRTLLASGGDDRTVRLWESHAGEPVRILNGHDGPVHSVCAVPLSDRTLLASAGDDRTVRLWEPRTGEPVWVLRGHDGPVRSVCAVLLPDHTLLASAGDDRTVRLWDPRTGHAVRVWEGHHSLVLGICTVLVADRTLLASASADNTVRLWDPDSGSDSPVQVFDGHDNWVFCVSEIRTAAGVRIASGGSDRCIRIWDPVTGRQEMEIPVHRKVWVLLSTPGRLVTTVSSAVLALEIKA